MLPILAAILPFLGKAAAGLLAAGKTAAGTILPSVLSSAASSLLGGKQENQPISDEQSGQGNIIQPQQVLSSPQNLFQYQPSNISQAIKDMLKSSRGF